MTKRLKIRLTGTENRNCRIYWEPETQEYIVRLFNKDKLYEPADYYTTDEDDALNTARHMCTSNLYKEPEMPNTNPEPTTTTDDLDTVEDWDCYCKGAADQCHSLPANPMQYTSPAHQAAYKLGYSESLDVFGPRPLLLVIPDYLKTAEEREPYCAGANHAFQGEPEQPLQYPEPHRRYYSLGYQDGQKVRAAAFNTPAG